MSLALLSYCSVLKLSFLCSDCFYWANNKGENELKVTTMTKK